MKPNYRVDIQCLRGIAVIAVVLFHAFENSFEFGYLGVDVFFVVSGFVVTPMVVDIFKAGQSRSATLLAMYSFYRRRAYRLIPALGFVIAFSAVLIFLFGSPLEHGRFARQGIATIFLLGNFGAFRYSGDYFSPNPNPLIHMWSLSVEEQIYLFLPGIFFLVFIFCRAVRDVYSKVLFSLLLLSFIWWLIASIDSELFGSIGVVFQNDFAFYSPFTRLWQFTLGGILAVKLTSKPLPSSRIKKIFNLCLASLLVCILFFKLFDNSFVSTFLITILTAIIIYLQSLSSLPVILLKAIEWIGYRSYSIYLVHMPLCYVAKYAPIEMFGLTQNTIFTNTLAVSLSFVLGAVIFSKVETPFRSYSDKAIGEKHSARKVLGYSLVIPLVLLALMDIGSQRNYFGLDRNIPRPSYAGHLDESCLRDSPNGPPCVYGSPDALKTVLLIGDSHAGHISQAMVEAAGMSGWKSVIWSHDGCKIMFKESQQSKVSRVCAESNQTTKRWIIQNKPDLVVVSQYLTRDDSYFEVREALIELSEVSKEILLIANNPVFPDGDKFMISRPVLMSPYAPPKVFLVGQMNNDHGAFMKRVSKWAISQNFAVIDFSPLFCGPQSCSRYSAEGWLYRDDNHFSVAGGKLTIPLLKKMLSERKSLKDGHSSSS